MEFLAIALFHCFQVVHNKNITKTQKVRFFTGQLLTHIASLYSWNGVVDVDLGNAEVRWPSAASWSLWEPHSRTQTGACTRLYSVSPFGQCLLACGYISLPLRLCFKNVTLQ